MRKVIKTILVVLILLVLIIIFFGQSPFSFNKRNNSKDDYSSIIEASVKDKNPRIVDIAMLGAHDAFTNDIKYCSDVDEAEPNDSILNNKLLNIIAKGVFVRLSRAQCSSPSQLLKKGVRYFDVRVSNINGKYYAKHALLSGLLDDYILDILEFLDQNDKEFIIFDLQHIHLGENLFDDFYKYLSNIKYNEKSIIDYIYYDTNSLKIGDLSYNDVTKNGAGVVFLAKYDVTNEMNKHFSYYDSIESIWHNKNTVNDLLGCINEQVKKYQEDPKTDILRVNQAQETGVIGGKETINTMINWSILDMAEWFNSYIIKQENIESWFDTMPILMVDFADSNKGQFNSIINNYIINYNNKKFNE